LAEQVTGQVIVRRGEYEATGREGAQHESENITASESLMKHQLPQARGQATTGEEITVEPGAGKHRLPESPLRPMA